MSDSQFFPNGTVPLVFEGFTTLNTNATRPAIEDAEMAVCDGFMPVGNGKLRTLYGKGSALYTGAANSVISYDFANIAATPYCIVFKANGSVLAVNTSTNAVTTIGGAGTITTPFVGGMGISSWGAQYVIIAAVQANGYFLWDGSLLYGAGSLAPGVTVTNGGSGYGSAPTVAASGGSGSGATFTATVSGGVVVSVAITNPGSGYSAGDTVTLNFSGGGGSGAAATVNLMPFGVQGQGAETYQTRVWLWYGATIFFSAPASPINFATSSGGGSFMSNDSFLRVGFQALQQTNGFLYLIGDSSINYISNVQTSGSPPTTTFSNQNANPEVGTPWGSTVQVFSENIVFANAFGAQVSYGGKVTKISEPLDGIYDSVPISSYAHIPSSAKAIIFGKRIWMLLLPIIDQITNTQVNKLLMWSGKVWWTSQQDLTLIFIASQEINSVLTAYGTDGTSIYPLFQNASSLFTKTVQSKLWSVPNSYMALKTSSRFWGLCYNNGGSTASVSLKIDNEITTSSLTLSLPYLGSSTSVVVIPPTATGQNGVLLGMTLSTSHSDFTLISAAIDAQDQGYRG